jgi:predicted MFS family arabinose efflux permease
LAVLFFSMPEKDKGWPIFFICLAVGSIPCFVVLWRYLCPQAGDSLGRGKDIE